MPNISNDKFRYEQRKRYYTKHRQHAVKGGRRWTDREEELVRRHDISDVELSRKLGRSVLAIQIKRCRLS